MLAKARQVASKLAILGTSWRQVGQLGPILAHLGAKMRPNSHPNGAPDALQIASWASLAPRGSPRTSKVPLELQFSTIFLRMLDRIRLIFQAAFFNFQPQVRHGGGLARAAHWIYIHTFLVTSMESCKIHGIAGNPKNPKQALEIHRIN